MNHLARPLLVWPVHFEKRCYIHYPPHTHTHTHLNKLINWLIDWLKYVILMTKHPSYIQVVTKVFNQVFAFKWKHHFQFRSIQTPYSIGSKSTYVYKKKDSPHHPNHYLQRETTNMHSCCIDRISLTHWSPQWEQSTMDWWYPCHVSMIHGV